MTTLRVDTKPTTRHGLPVRGRSAARPPKKKVLAVAAQHHDQRAHAPALCRTGRPAWSDRMSENARPIPLTLTAARASGKCRYAMAAERPFSRHANHFP